MIIEELKPKGIYMLRLEGRFDAHTVPDVNKWLDEVTLNLPPQIIVDMSDVNFVDSAGLATLVRGVKRSREMDGNLVVFGLQQPVRIIIELTRLDKAIDVFNSKEDAVGSFEYTHLNVV